MPASLPLSPNYLPLIQPALDRLAADDIIPRIWMHDHTVWRPEPAEISNRLGWLDNAEAMLADLPRIEAFVAEVRAAGYNYTLLLGMGGSSLAPEVFRRAFGVADGSLDLAVLDTTDPGAVLGFARTLDPARTLFIVATKSGGTVETLSGFRYFYKWTADALGEAQAGAHFVAITDPGSSLVALAARCNFRAVFENNPEIGGRYAALSHFGLVPAALLGVDMRGLLRRAVDAAADSRREGNSAAQLGAALGALARAGRDKLTLVLPPQIASFGDWVEQLVAESTGKEGRGILPVVGETLGDPAQYMDDRFFVALELPGENAHSARLAALEAAGDPVVRLPLRDVYDLGAQFFLWEFATAVAGHVLDIQPFDQPNVEAAKNLARKMVAAYHETGTLPEGEAAPFTGLAQFLEAAPPGDYLCLQAYLTPTPATTAALQTLRHALRDRTGLAVTVGYGPRFLHSTGQLHKGDAGNGLFIQLTADAPEDAPIPDEAGSAASAMSFGVLIQAQALGDYEALKTASPPRRVIRFHLSGDPAAALGALA